MSAVGAIRPLIRAGGVGALGVGLLMAAVAGSTVAPAEREALRSSAPTPKPAAALREPSDGERWFDDMLSALAQPTPVELPFRDVASGDDRPVATYAFEAAAGQTLEVAVAAESIAPSESAQGRSFVEVFRVRDVLGHPLHERLGALRSGSHVLRTRLPSDGTYVVLAEPEQGDSPYRLTLEVEAALRFPVLEGEVSEIRSGFGAVRDGGRRQHQGIDIYAKRLTPVLAVVSGVVRPAQDRLGGNTVWLSAAGTSYYYAHLDRVAVRENQRVKAGEVLGYVGNTGNARNTPTHLHFAVYRWGKEPVDPLPLLTTRRFARDDPPPGAGAGG
jgi:murein DD-endopeptidase MepM/ murein hydrolase activator NlpD